MNTASIASTTTDAPCDQPLYADGSRCGRTTNLIAGFDSHGNPINRCRRHAKAGYGFNTDRPSAESIAKLDAILKALGR